MRLKPPVLVVLSYGAGLATGLAAFLVPALVGLVPVMVLGWSARRSWTVFPALVLLGAVSGALAGQSEREACRVALPEGRWEAVVSVTETPDTARGMGRVDPEGHGCRGEVAARWPRGSRNSVGTRLQIRGRWVAPPPERARAGGILLLERADSVGFSLTPGERLRLRLQATTARLYGRRAPLVDALILNRKAALDPGLSEAYASSGLVHILSISGFHVGLIAGWLLLLARLAGMNRSRASLAAALLSVLYVAFIGWPTPATRAAALVVLLAVCRWRQRQVDAESLLAVTCLAVLVLNPHAVFELGAWLSAAALWGATRFSRWSDRALGSGASWRMLASSVGATLATAPFTAAVLGSVALVGIGLNFVAIPLAAVAVPGVLASLVLDPVSPALAGALAAGSGACLSLLDGVARFGAQVPGGHIVQPLGWRAAVPWAALLVFVLWTIGRANTLRVAWTRWAGAFALASWFGVGYALVGAPADSGSDLALHFLAVGQGDGAVIRTPGGHWVLIDAGPRGETGDAGQRVVVPFLRRQGVRRLAAVIVSHVHADHLGGVPAVLERFPSDIVIEPGDVAPDPRYAEFLRLLDRWGLRWHPGRARDRFEIDSVRFTILHPDTTWVRWGEDLNEDSIVLLVQYREFTALFPGDAGLATEPRWLAQAGPVDLLKVGHHGSRTATGDSLLARTRPRAAVISVGRNTYGHPAPATLARLRSHGIAVWRTDQDGAVTVRTDGHDMTLCATRGCARMAVTP